MAFPNRRLFLGASVGAFASYPLLGEEPKKEPAKVEKESTPRKSTREDYAFQPNTLFLTWTKDPTTTMTVQWIGVWGETSNVNLYYSPSKTGILTMTEQMAPTLKAYPMTDYKIFRYELKGLTPNTEYTFRIGRSSPPYKFRTMPTKATNEISFVSGGDCGINPAAVANNIQAAKQDPDFAIIAGDLGYDNGRSVEVSLTFIRNYSKTMVTRDGRLIPLIAGIGNHEVDGGYNKSRDKAPFFYALFDGLYPETGYATLDFGDYLSLVMLDTGHTSPISGEQTRWLEKVLKDRAEHPNLYVVNHVPAYPSHRNPEAASVKPGQDKKFGTGEENRINWVPLFEKYGVPIVLEHHDHTFKRSKLLLNGHEDDNGVLYLGDGSWGRIRVPKSPEKLTYLAKTSEDFHITLHRIQDNKNFHMAMDESGKIMDVSVTSPRRKGYVPVQIPESKKI